MDTGILDVLGDGVLNDLALIGNGIELDLLRFGHELRNHYGELFRDLCGHIQETMQLFFVVADIHRSTREHIRRTYEDGIAHLGHECLHIVERGEGLPCGLVDTQLVEHG